MFIHGNMPLDRKTAHHGGDVCDVCFASKKSSEREFFVPAGMHLGVNRNTPIMVWAGMKNSRPVGFLQ
jgi:hypothetical protein